MEKPDWTKKITLFLSGLSLVAFIWVSITNHKLIQKQQEWQKESRRNDIAPDIRLSSASYLDSIVPEHVTIVFENIGKGVAQDIFLWIGNGKEIYPMVFHQFDTAFGTPTQNYIKPGEKLKLRINALMFDKNRSLKSRSDSLSAIIANIFTFYFSYFDVDGNEYLLVITEQPATIGGEMLFNVRKGIPLDSTLLSLPRSKRFIYKNINLRDKFRWVKKELAK